MNNPDPEPQREEMAARAKSERKALEDAMVVEYEKVASAVKAAEDAVLTEKARADAAEAERVKEHQRAEVSIPTRVRVKVRVTVFDGLLGMWIVMRRWWRLFP